MLRLAFLTTDGREVLRRYQRSSPEFGTAPEALLQGLAGWPEVEVHVLSCVQQLPPSSPEKLADNIWYHAVHAPKIGWMRTLYQGCIRATRKKLREIQPDIVHGQGTERENALAAVFSGCPNVITIHGNMRLLAQLNRAKPFSFGWLAARLEEFTIPRSDGVICITNYTRAAVDRLAKRTWVVPNAVDASFFKVEPNPSEKDGPLVLCVGHVERRKNQNSFIRALDPLAAELKFKVMFLGLANRGDAYNEEFLHLVSSRSWCSHAGFVDRKKLKELLPGASLLVLPSLEDNCPMVVLEAMAAGIPVLAARVGGVPDLIEDEKNGLFCDPLDAASMRTSFARLLKNPSLGRELAIEARRRAREQFHPQAIARRHLEIYREILELKKEMRPKSGI